MLKRIFFFALLALASSYPAYAQYLSPGGSNYAWYRVGVTQTNPCDREPYGVIYNYDVETATINSQLQAMYSNGQRRLRIPIFFGRGLNTGTVMDSTGGNLSPRFRYNLANFLNSVRQHGFVEIEVSFHPITYAPVGAHNDPTTWGAFSEDYYQENWNVIANLRPIIIGAGIPYLLDLTNEAIPNSNQSALLHYARRLWSDYTSTFGKNDTVGFSVVGDEPGRVQQIPAVYQGNYPYLFDMHFYDNAGSNFVSVRNTLANWGLTQGWIIGETFYDDPQEARELEQAIYSTGQTVFFVLQWPLTRTSPCAHVNVGVPLTNTAYYNNVQNPIDDSQFFVRQQYLDFLSREPDPDGFRSWLTVLQNCSDVNNNPACDRITVSSSFFRGNEFQLKGFYVYRFYKLAFNRLPLYEEIMPDMNYVSGSTPQEVYQRKAQLAELFTQRPEFQANFGGKSNSEYVAILMSRYQLTSITTFDPANPDGAQKVTLTNADLVHRLNTNMLSRAQVLRAVADSDEVGGREYNQAFVAMQYYGYLRRTPDEAGYHGWLNYLNANPTDFRTMINGFMNSNEYRSRFG
jgi:hypothetical protein